MTETAAQRPGAATIVAVVREDGGQPVIQRAVELARDSGAGVILYDLDAGGRLLEDPLPTEWSAHGEEEQFGDRLTINDLEAAGRAPLARQVGAVQREGIEAWGWLPRDQKAESLRDYAARQGATAVVVPGDVELGGDLRGGAVRVEVVG